MTYSSHQQETARRRTPRRPPPLPHRHRCRRRARLPVNLPTAGAASAAELDARKITEDPFTLGVASGDPLPDSVLLWTRLAPRPYEPDSGLPHARVPVRWELARDERFTRIVRRGTATAHPEFDHSVHVEVKGLDADRVFYYRFRAGKWISQVGRTRTAPARRTPATAR